MAASDGLPAARQSLTVLLIVPVALGGLGVGLIWSGLNELTATGSVTSLGLLGVVAGVLLLGAVCVYLWRYLNGLLSEAQQRANSGTRRDT